MGRIKKNLFYQATAQFGSKGLMFIAYMLLARILGPETYGVFDYSFAYIQIIGGIFFDLGLSLVVIRELSINNTGIFSAALWFKGAGTIAGCIIIAILGFFLGLPIQPVIFLTCFTIFNSFINLYFCAFRAKERMHGEAISLILQKSILVLLLFLFYKGMINIPGGSGLIISSASFGVSALIGLAAVFILLRYSLPGFISYDNLKKSYDKIKSLAKEALPLIGVSIFWLVYYKIDIILLGLLSTKEEVGYYSASYKIMEASFVIPVIIMNSIYPALSRLQASGPEYFLKAFKKTAVILILLGTLIALIVSFASGPLVKILFGDKFSPSADILIILILSSIPVYAGHLVTQSLVIIGLQKKYLLISIIAAIGNILLNLIFIPLWNARGAALTTLITETTVTCIAWVIIIKNSRDSA